MTSRLDCLAHIEDINAYGLGAKMPHAEFIVEADAAQAEGEVEWRTNKEGYFEGRWLTEVGKIRLEELRMAKDWG